MPFIPPEMAAASDEDAALSRAPSILFPADALRQHRYKSHLPTRRAIREAELDCIDRALVTVPNLAPYIRARLQAGYAQRTYFIASLAAAAAEEAHLVGIRLIPASLACLTIAEKIIAARLLARGNPYREVLKCWARSLHAVLHLDREIGRDGLREGAPGSAEKHVADDALHLRAKCLARAKELGRVDQLYAQGTENLLPNLLRDFQGESKEVKKLEARKAAWNSAMCKAIAHVTRIIDAPARQ
ncbi:hypothetical protein HDZ31DRAFT_64225 [Schizophyllum fasciatum]